MKYLGILAIAIFAIAAQPDLAKYGDVGGPAPSTRPGAGVQPVYGA